MADSAGYILGILLILVAFAVALAPLLSFLAVLATKVLALIALVLGAILVSSVLSTKPEQHSVPHQMASQPRPSPTSHDELRLSIMALCQLDGAIYETRQLRQSKGEIACLATTYLMVLRLSDGGRQLRSDDWTGDMVKRLIQQTQGGRISEERTRIKKELDQGRPVIVGANTPASINHWVLVTGYSGNQFLVHDPWTGEAYKPLEQAVRYSPNWTTRFLIGVSSTRV